MINITIPRERIAETMGVMMGAMIRIIARARGMNEVLVTRDL